MPELLAICADTKLHGVIDVVAQKCSFRSKFVLSVASALDWIDLKGFDVVLLHYSIVLEEQQRIADHIWKRNPLATIVIFDFEAEAGNWKHEARLFGAEIVGGAKASDDLCHILDAVPRRAARSGGDFEILVVEDLDSPRDIVCAYIESLGFPRVEGTNSAKAALALLQGVARKIQLHCH